MATNTTTKSVRINGVALDLPIGAHVELRFHPTSVADTEASIAAITKLAGAFEPRISDNGASNVWAEQTIELGATDQPIRCVLFFPPEITGQRTPHGVNPARAQVDHFLAKVERKEASDGQ